MKLADKVTAIEDRTVQASMLQVAQSFHEDADDFAHWICALADQDVLKEPGEELRGMAAQSQRKAEAAAAPDNEPEVEEEDDKDIVLKWGCILYDMFCTTQLAWRKPGAEQTLFDVLRKDVVCEDSPFVGLSNVQMRITLDREIDRRAKEELERRA